MGVHQRCCHAILVVYSQICEERKQDRFNDLYPARIHPHLCSRLLAAQRLLEGLDALLDALVVPLWHPDNREAPLQRRDGHGEGVVDHAAAVSLGGRLLARAGAVLWGGCRAAAANLALEGGGAGVDGVLELGDAKGLKRPVDGRLRGQDGKVHDAPAGGQRRGRRRHGGDVDVGRGEDGGEESGEDDGRLHDLFCM